MIKSKKEKIYSVEEYKQLILDRFDTCLIFGTGNATAVELKIFSDRLLGAGTDGLGTVLPAGVDLKVTIFEDGVVQVLPTCEPTKVIQKNGEPLHLICGYEELVPSHISEFEFAGILETCNIRYGLHRNANDVYKVTVKDQVLTLDYVDYTGYDVVRGLTGFKNRTVLDHYSKLVSGVFKGTTAFNDMKALGGVDVIWKPIGERQGRVVIKLDRLSKRVCLTDGEAVLTRSDVLNILYGKRPPSCLSVQLVDKDYFDTVNVIEDYIKSIFSNLLMHNRKNQKNSKAFLYYDFMDTPIAVDSNYWRYTDSKN